MRVFVRRTKWPWSRSISQQHAGRISRAALINRWRTNQPPIGVYFERPHLPRIVSIPASTELRWDSGSLPTRSVSSSLSMLMISETFATEGFGRPVTCADGRIFPGAIAHFRLLVSGTQTTVAMRLRFTASLCTTTTGLLNPGPEPAGVGRSAHHISPCEITTRCAP